MTTENSSAETGRSKALSRLMLAAVVAVAIAFGAIVGRRTHGGAEALGDSGHSDCDHDHSAHAESTSSTGDSAACDHDHGENEA